MQALWTPSEDWIKSANLFGYQQWLQTHKQLSFNDYHELWLWSVNDLSAFWKSIWEYFQVIADGEIAYVLQGSMPHTKWFEGTLVNYAEHVFRNETSSHLAIVFKAEDSPVKEISWIELKTQVAAFQSFLKKKGVVKGDRVAAFLPCVPEATIAFLATNALGAIWSSCSPDFGLSAVLDRFTQIEPKILIAQPYYKYNGKAFNKEDVVADLAKAIPSLQHVVLITDKDFAIDKPATLWRETLVNEGTQLEFIRVPFSHPIWILYSSGTTGLPKAIVHSQGGILLEQLKYASFHNNFKKGDKCFWYTTTGWMMWNYIHSSLLVGATLVLYDGSPAYPKLTVLWEFVEDTGINHFGTSAGFILANIKQQIIPNQQFDLSSLRSISSTGSTLPPEGFEWIYDHVKKDLWLVSMSGGTDVCSAFVGGNPQLPVYKGEIQCRALGCRLEAFNESGEAVIDEVGEMVITRPMPSMPIYFWKDPQFKRYKESYFEMFPSIWRHGDWIQITPRNGVIIFGRSDATLNREGIRIGTSEIYRAVDKVKEVKDSLIICLEQTGGKFWMPLFVVMQEGVSLTDNLKKTINTILRSDYTPRHVPDDIIEVPDIPYTLSGKKSETPIKKVLMGKNPADVISAGSLRNPESINYFIGLNNLKT